MGACIYTPGKKAAYIPINHVDFYTETRLQDQLTELDIKEQFDRLKNTKVIMHNGKFDYQVLKCTCNCTLNVYWDTFLAACILDENTKHGLKDLYTTLIDKSQDKYSIESLYGDIPYEYLPYDVFKPYAATDAYETYELYKFQLNELSKKENSGLMNVFKNI